MTSKTRECPYCVSEIPRSALVCRYCQRDLPPLPQKSSSDRWWIVGMVIVVLFMCRYLLGLSASETPEQAAASVPTWTPTAIAGQFPAKPSPRPRPSATKRPAPIGRLIVNVPSANLRAGPGTDQEIVGTAATGERFDVYGRTGAEGAEWWKLDRLGTVWIAAEIAAYQTRGMDSSFSMATVYCREFVEESLKAPSTAQFSRDTYDRTTYYLGNGRYQVQSWVDAQNSFGAQIRTDYRCLVEHVQGDTFRLVELQTDP